MIYLFDQSLTEKSHSKYIIDIINQHTIAEIKVVELDNPITYGDIMRKVYDVMYKVLPKDIVLCPWLVEKNDKLNELFAELGNCCYVIAAAGNYNKPVENYTPAGADNVITVGTLNKSGLAASLSNYGDKKPIIWIPGTNYDVGWKNSSGTSVSAALYAAFLNESIRTKDPDKINFLIEQQKIKVLQELKR